MNLNRFGTHSLPFRSHLAVTRIRKKETSLVSDSAPVISSASNLPSATEDSEMDFLQAAMIQDDELFSAYLHNTRRRTDQPKTCRGPRCTSARTILILCCRLIRTSRTVYIVMASFFPFAFAFALIILSGRCLSPFLSLYLLYEHRS